METRDVMEIIRIERVRQDMPQYKLAELVGVSRQAVNNFERGRYNPTLETLLAMLRALGLEMVIKKG